MQQYIQARMRAELTDWLEAVRSGGAVKRCHTVPVIGEPRVDAHSWGVAVILHKIAPNCRKELILAAIFHDVPEKWTGDVPANVKWRRPSIKVELEEAETEINDQLSIDFNLTDDELDLLKFADRLELLWYCVDQRRLGNRNVDGIQDNVITWFNTSCPVVASNRLAADMVHEANVKFCDVKRRP